MHFLFLDTPLVLVFSLSAQHIHNERKEKEKITKSKTCQMFVAFYFILFYFFFFRSISRRKKKVIIGFRKFEFGHFWRESKTAGRELFCKESFPAWQLFFVIFAKGRDFFSVRTVSVSESGVAGGVSGKLKLWAKTK